MKPWFLPNNRFARGVWPAVLAFAVAGCASGPRHRTPPQASAASALDLTFPPLNFSGEVHVDFTAKTSTYSKIALLPFKCAVDIAGQSIPDIVATEIFKTSKYELIERGQIESVLKEQEFRLQGVIDEAAAVALGRVLGVQGVVIGTISEYGLQRRGISAVPAVGMSIRMIDTTTGKLVWSVSHSLVGFAGESLSQTAQRAASDMIMALSRAWIDMGDRTAPGLPPPQELPARGGVREAFLEWPSHSSKLIAGYEIQRRNPGEEAFTTVKRLVNQHGNMAYTDPNLLDLTQYTYRVFTVSRFGLISASCAECDVVTLGPPARPEAPDAKSGLIRSVELAWSAPDDPNVTGYVVKRREAGVLKEIARLPGKAATRYVDTGSRAAPLEDGKVYGYMVTAFNKAGVESDPSEEVHAKTLPPPSAVRGLQAQSGLPRAVALTWEPNPDTEQVDGYRVLRALDADGPFATAGQTRGRLSTEFTDHNRNAMKDETRYFYRALAFNSKQADSPSSETVSAVTKPAPPPPSGTLASDGRVKSVDLQWSRSPSDEVVKYRIYRAVGDPGRFSLVGDVPADVLTHVDTPLQDGQTYRYQVTALDADQLESEPTPPVTGTTKPRPGPPTLSCAGADTGIELTWTHDDPGSIAAYRIYEAGFLGRTRVAETAESRHLIPAAPGKRMKLTVTAIDHDGLESLPSETVLGRRDRP